MTHETHEDTVADPYQTGWQKYTQGKPYGACTGQREKDGWIAAEFALADLQAPTAGGKTAPALALPEVPDDLYWA